MSDDVSNFILANDVAEFIITCNDDVLQKLTVLCIAGRFDVNRSHLVRVFKSVKQFTLSQFIRKEKMARAASLLRENHYIKIEDLARKMGYGSTDYFSEVFKQYYAVSPSEYRKYKTNHLKK